MADSSDPQASSPAGAQFGPWIDIYKGVTFAAAASLQCFRPGGGKALQRVTALKIDLRQEGLDFRTTAAAVTSDGSAVGNGVTAGLTIAEFAKAYGVVLAINANLSAKLAGDFDFPNPHQLAGLAVDRGAVVCDPAKPAYGVEGTDDVPSTSYIGCTALMIHGSPGDFTATIGLATGENAFERSGLRAAIAGSRNGNPGPTPRPPSGAQIPFLVQGGAVSDFVQTLEDDTDAAGRTGVGVSADGRTLFLVVVEGREGGEPAYGATFFDIATWMVAVGADTAVSVDGGGSSAMVKVDPDADPLAPRIIPLNIQYGDEKTPGSQRTVGNYFGIIAPAL